MKWNGITYSTKSKDHLRASIFDDDKLLSTVDAVVRLKMARVKLGGIEGLK